MKSIKIIGLNNSTKTGITFLLIIISMLLPREVSYSYYNNFISKSKVPFHPPGYIEFSNDTVPSITVNAVNAQAGLLYDMTENKVIWVKALNSKHDIASLSKMMTVLLVIESINEGKFGWDSLVTVPKEATEVGGSSVYLKEGEVFPVRELVKASMIASGNDAAYTLACFTSGNEKQFVNMMNWKAAELGMDSSFFSNATGMPAYRGMKDNYSTPHDLLLLATELIKHKEIFQYTAECEDCINHGTDKFPYKNHNSLVIHYKNEVDGLKTGFTRGAGFCLVATANRAEHRIISIILGVASSYTRDNMVADMMNKYYTSIGLGKLGDPIIK
jgi:D-alanyl-D-alanine carboxypeptidase (penicillin-binding protein 5/6)